MTRSKKSKKNSKNNLEMQTRMHSNPPPEDLEEQVAHAPSRAATIANDVQVHGALRLLVDTIWRVGILVTRDAVGSSNVEEIAERCTTKSKTFFAIATCISGMSLVVYLTFRAIPIPPHLQYSLIQQSFMTSLAASTSSFILEGMILALLGKHGFRKALTSGHWHHILLLVLTLTEAITITIATVAGFIGILAMIWEGGTPKALAIFLTFFSCTVILIVAISCITLLSKEPRPTSTNN